MTSRDRYLASILFRKPDKITFWPGGGRESTLAAWRTQGLPEEADLATYLFETLGADPAARGATTNLDVSFKMMPQFEEKVLEHRDGHYVVQDWMGAITEISDRYDYTYLRSARDFVTRKWHKFPVENPKDWEKMVSRFDPDTPGRHGGDLDAAVKKARGQDVVINIHFNGPFWQLREWLGLQNLCLMMADDPDFVQEMIDFWTEFASKTLGKILSRVSPDQVGFSEDMAYKAHSMISPDMVRRFLVPAYERWISEARAAGCEVIYMDSDGNIEVLLPIWVDVGINFCGPVEVAAGNDIVDYRRIYGKRMAFRGGIDKRAIAKGGKVMEAEVMRVVPPLLEQGGYIPCCDHGVPPDVSWPNYLNYARMVAKLTGWL